MKTHEMTRIALATAILSVAVYMIPPLQLSFLPVPFTLQLLMVLFISLLLPPKEVVIALCIYLTLGAIGLPVFSGGRGGLSILLGPTGGFLWMFPIVGGLISFYRNSHHSLIQVALFQILIVYMVMYPIAVGWLAFSVNQPWLTTFISMIPFMLIDGSKIFIATLLYKHIPISTITSNQVK